jgi:uncharacterized protein
VRIHEIIWKQRFAEKIEQKHNVAMGEVEEVVFHRPFIRRIERGTVSREHVYAAYGQTGTGRYLVVFFIHKAGKAAMPISARDMTAAERRYYEGQT